MRRQKRAQRDAEACKAEILRVVEERASAEAAAEAAASQAVLKLQRKCASLAAQLDSQHFESR